MAGGDMGNGLQAKLRGDVLSFTVKSGEFIGRGAPVAVDTAAGTAQMAADTASQVFVGVAEEGWTAAESAAATRTVRCRRHGIFRMKLTGVATTDVGKMVYAETAQTASVDYAVALTADSTNKVLVGIIVKYDTTNYCWVDITPAIAQSAQGTVDTHAALTNGTAHTFNAIDTVMTNQTGTTPVLTFAELRAGRVIDCSDNALATVTFDTAANLVALADGIVVTILKTGSGLDPVAFTAGATSTIMGAATWERSLPAGSAITFTYDRTNANWVVVAIAIPGTAIAETSATPTCTAAEFMHGLVTNTQAVATIDFALPASGVLAGSRCLFVNTGAAVADLPKFDIDATSLVGPHCAGNHCYAGNGIGDSVEILCTADDTYVVLAVNQASRVNIAKGAGAQSITNAQAMSFCRVDLANTCVLTLPAAAAGNAGADVILSTSGASATVVCAAGFAGAGSSYDTLTPTLGNACHVYSDGTNWHCIHFTTPA